MQREAILTTDIRTYAVMPLNEECGLLEWVSNTNALKRILEKEYARQNKKIYVSGVKLGCINGTHGAAY